MAHGPNSAAGIAGNLEAAGRLLLRYGLVLVIGWIGAMKFTTFEAAGVKPLVETSPFLRWMYRVLSEQGISNLLGVVELSIAAMIAVRPIWPAVAAGKQA
ncbi:MAG: DUF417 family protein [Gemmatimonadales bacterium]